MNRNKNLNYNYFVNNEKSTLKGKSFAEIKDERIEKQSQEQREPFKTTVKFLEKEKEFTEELKARYDVQVISNSKLEKRIKELEIMLNNERTKVEEIRSQSSKDIQIEKDMRLKYEDQVLKLKEDLMKKEIESNKALQEVEIKLSNIFQENANFQNENKLVRDQLERIKGAYEEKYKGLEENSNKNSSYLEETIDTLRIENEKIRKDFQDELKVILRDWERKFKAHEENFKALKMQKDDLERENSNLKKEFIDFKIDKEMEYKQRESRMIEEEVLISFR